VAALIEAGLVDRRLIETRLSQVSDRHASAAAHAADWLASL